MQKRNWILLVEEEKGACEELKAVILHLGYQVLSCAECSRAHWYLQNQKFSCVIIDQKVSGANGLAVVTAVKKNRNHLNNKTPFILMSETLEEELVNRVAGRIEGALLKPFAQAQFIEKVKSVVDPK
jgi:DNA-binding response OmpR family regulator